MKENVINKHFRALFIALTTWGGLAVAASPALETLTFDVQGYSSLEHRGIGDITLIQGTTEGVTIVAPERLLDRIKVNVAGNTLKIDIEPKRSFRWFRDDRVDIEVRFIALDEIASRGSGDIESDNLRAEDLAIRFYGSGDADFAQLKAKTVDVELVGSGDLRVKNLEADHLEALVRGSGDAILRGFVNAHSVFVQGSGDYDAAKLKTNSSSVRILGSGDAVVNADETLDVDIKGSGDVRYRGEVKSPKVKVKGSGDVARI